MPLFSSLYPQLRLPHFKAAPEFGSTSSKFVQKNSQQPSARIPCSSSKPECCSDCFWRWIIPFEALPVDKEKIRSAIPIAGNYRLIDSVGTEPLGGVCGAGRDEDFGFGIFKLNAENQVLEFRENPETNTVLKSISVENLANFDENVKAFSTATDLKSQVIPGAISLGMKVHAYQFDGYWEDMGSIAAYYRANMETIRRTNKAYNFYDRASPMYTLPRHLPPSLVTDAVITDSVIGDGCILCKCRIRGTVVGMRTRIGDDAVIEDSVILGSDSYHHNGISEGEATGIPVGIGEGSHIRKAIIDKNARIGKNVMIINKDSVREGNMEANGYIISGGIVVVIRSAVIPDGSIL
ncbi:UNVERIFIED_CONTAM: Inactive glucose-1-phosphate adenylyltransferase small subunit, chloroplastic [Sesamum calycinum]|uniref:Inactive glucose-1-phosphate adenylyltransferase small subunit, chloroplastic n=1 Tax=Sesamum calycinum TaxID=2727403 RepID=A0AAW2QLL0_9LAMI